DCGGLSRRRLERTAGAAWEPPKAQDTRLTQALRNSVLAGLEPWLCRPPGHLFERRESRSVARADPCSSLCHCRFPEKLLIPARDIRHARLPGVVAARADRLNGRRPPKPRPWQRKLLGCVASVGFWVPS